DDPKWCPHYARAEHVVWWKSEIASAAAWRPSIATSSGCCTGGTNASGYCFLRTWPKPWALGGRSAHRDREQSEGAGSHSHGNAVHEGAHHPATPTPGRPSLAPMDPTPSRRRSPTLSPSHRRLGKRRPYSASRHSAGSHAHNEAPARPFR